MVLQDGQSSSAKTKLNNMAGNAEKLAGNASFKAGQWVEAIGHYSRAITKDPRNETYYLNRAQAYLKLNKFLDAERDATSCLALKPKHPKALFRRALARKSLVNLTGAREDLQEALELEPTNEAIRAEIQQVEALQEALDREDAIKKERQAQLLSRAPSSPRGPKATPSKETLAAVVQSTGDDSFMRPVSTRRLDAKAAKPAVSSFSAAKEAREARLAGVEPRSAVKAAAAPAPEPLPRAPPAERVARRQPARPIKTAYDLVNQWREAKTDSEPATAFWASLETLQPEALPGMLQSSLEPDMLKDIVLACDSAANKAHATALLSHLSQVPRFDFLAMFLEAPERDVVDCLLTDPASRNAWLL